jgi:3'-phosphoadenosine 5'-phosphosulfate sulfotransferase (PAPS reductase)/FAD synthetase
MHSNLKAYKNLVQETKQTINLVLSNFDKPYVAYSGGKDSCVLLHLILKYDPDIMIYHWDYGPNFIPRTLEHKLLQNAFKMGARRMIYATSERYLRRETYVWYKDFIGHELPKLAEAGYDISFIGLRAEESSKRKHKTKKAIRYGSHMCNAYPLRNWSYKDIYAYLLRNKVPYLKEHYDKYSKLLGYNESRFVTFHDPEFSQLSKSIDGILMYKHKNDDVR